MYILIKELKLFCYDFRGKLIWDDNLRLIKDLLMKKLNY